MNIVLTGFMGTGKTAIGKALADNLHWPYIDTDALIEEREGLKISEIFEKFGEEHFRKIEKNIIKMVSSFNNHVISTGGGAVLHKENMDNLEMHGFVVNLYASPEVIFDRIKQNNERPLLNKPDPRGEIERMLKNREKSYDRCDIRVNTDSSDIAEAVEKIIAELNRVPEKV